MNRYCSPNALVGTAGGGAAVCVGTEERALLEQLVELGCARNQLLCDLLGAVNALTAVLLARREDTGG